MHGSLKTTWLSLALLGLSSALFVAEVCPAFAQAPTANQAWRYLLLNDSSLLDDCPICDRVTVPQPMRGTFNLRLLESNPLFSRYAVEDIDFTARLTRSYAVRGSGTFQIGGEVSVVQQMWLQVQIDDGFTNKLCYFTNVPSVAARPWPMIDITIEQTNGTPGKVYTLRLVAAPVREIWFSSVNSFTAGSGPSAGNAVGQGDLLSTSGRIVKRNADLFTSVGAFPPIPDLGLDAIDVLSGGEIVFSLGQGIFSLRLGQLQRGDLLSNKGYIVRRNQDLLAPFQPDPAGPDAGLDAVQVLDPVFASHVFNRSNSADAGLDSAQALDTGEILFSIPTNVVSKKLHATLQRGDLLSSAGLIVRSNQQLLARFHPSNPTNDYGLDALYIWPSGEIWFSTEDSFQDQSLGAILAGDLLSDQGYIVLRNADLLAAFAPTLASPDFGLDALYVITDATPPAPAPRLSIAAKADTRGVGLTWQGQGRVFQVERAGRVADPFQPLTPIIPDLSFDDLGALTNRTQGYYRLRQW